MRSTTSLRLSISSLLLGTLALQGCTPSSNSPSVPSATQTDPVAQASLNAATSSMSLADLTDTAPDASSNEAGAASYTPPSAAQLIQLLAPVAVFPDTLIAQVLAASSYPDQVGAAYAWYQRNNGLKGVALQNAVDQQSWDASVKAIATFPDVLHQMASNMAWTTALGEAYVNDPTDVMNAIQALRQQAVACNNLKSNQYLKVTTLTKSDPPGQVAYEDVPATYAGPPVIPPPQQVIEIAPAQPDYVYVPQYDPSVFYGAPIVAYPGYVYAWPAPIYAGPLFGAFGFGLGIAIDFGHPWGWGRWGVNWGPGFGRPGYAYGLHGAAVVYNNHAYFGHSNTIVNHFEGRGPGSFAATQGARPNVASAAGHFAAPGISHPAIGEAAHTMSTPHFASSMAAHTATFQTSHVATSAMPARSSALPSSHFAPSSLSHAGMTASPAALHANSNRPASASFAPQRSANTQQAYGNRSQVQSVHSSNLANTPRYNNPQHYSNLQHYASTGVQHGYANNTSLHSFNGAAHAQTRVSQGPHGAAHSAPAGHVGGGGQQGRHR